MTTRRRAVEPDVHACTRLIVRSAVSFSLSAGNAYHSAAQSFVQVTSDIQGAYSDVLTGRDVATYGAMCALASFSRKELKDEVINNTEFKKLLDLNAPTTWKLIVQQFYNSNYAKVFELLEGLKVSKETGVNRRFDHMVCACTHAPLRAGGSCSRVCQNDLYLDLFLSSHVNRLIRQIRERAFIQYFKSASSHTPHARYGCWFSVLVLMVVSLSASFVLSGLT
jgi:hypothetical protein